MTGIRDDVSVNSKASRISRLTGRAFRQVDQYKDFFVDIKELGVDKKKKSRRGTSRASRIGKNRSKRNSQVSILTQNKQIFSTYGAGDEAQNNQSQIVEKTLSLRDQSLENNLNTKALSFKDI